MLQEPEQASYQQRFNERWQHLHDPHVRALAWLIDAPDLLDVDAPQWQGKIATLGAHSGSESAGWLSELDRQPAALHAYLGATPYTRLGRYAEKLMAYYFARRGILVGHGLQVQAGKSATIGEFDFLLRDGARGEGLLHWEFAIKFYLLEAGGPGSAADYFVGPNLADTLGAKMSKILDRQLALSAHPAAQAYLMQPVSAARALVKGWLFYHRDQPGPALGIGLAPDHCRGFWCTLAELAQAPQQPCMILNRIAWLAPAKIPHDEAMPAQELHARLRDYFVQESMPVLVALLAPQGEMLVESARGFIVPDDWRKRAAERIAQA